MLRSALRARANIRPILSSGLFTASIGVGACPKRRSKQSNEESGEDAYFVRSTTDGIYAGVFDGVGGWADSGVDPSIFSAGLAKHCESIESSEPEVILQQGYDKVQTDPKIEMGSSTACVAAVSLATAAVKIANLGDSGFLLADKQGNVVYESKPQIYFFNAPYQLAKIPKSMRRSGSLENVPRDNDVTAHDLGPGYIILATDGFFDNVFAKDAESLIKANLKDSKKIATSLMQEAVKNGRSRKDGPFAAEALRHKMRYHGGKEDDVVVIVIHVDEVKAKL